MSAFEQAFALLMKSLPIDVDWDNKKLPPPIEVEWDCKKCGKSKSGEDKCECPSIKKGEAMDFAWQLLKTDMKLPRPHDVPKYTDPHANLAFYGSKNPFWQQYPEHNFETFDASRAGMAGFVESLRDEINRRTGKLVEPADAPWKYDVGDFAENLKDGVEPGAFYTPATAGVDQVYNEIERASVVEAMNDAGIFEESEIARVLDEWYHAEGLGSMTLREQGKSRRMGNEKGRQINRLEDFHD